MWCADTEKDAPVRRASLSGATAVVTGGASGIGRALGEALLDGGAMVVLADRDSEKLARTVEQLTEKHGELVRGCTLDVSDRAAVQALVADTSERHGGIDYFFNNAGISLGGPTHEQSGEHWDRIIETNLGGVVNGVLAAYPLMVSQGHGHIINTASAAGLVPPPFVVAYAATKHAVVGVTTGLRPEAALHGVRVSVLCPGAVETSILDSRPSSDLPRTLSEPVTPRAYLARLHQRPISAERFAATALAHVLRNRAIIVIPRITKSLWYLHRLSPTLAQNLSKSIAKIVDKDLVRPQAIQPSLDS